MITDVRDQDTYYRVGQVLAKKWAPLLEGVKGEYNILSTAILLENEARKGTELITETTLSGQGVAAAPNVATFQHYLLPLVRRVYPNLVTNELVGIQPMTSPASLVFYLKYKYSGLVELESTGVHQHGMADQSYNKGQTVAGTEYANFIGDTWFIDPYYSLQTIYREPATIAAAAGGVANAVILAGHALGATPYINSTGSITFEVADAATAAAATNVVEFTINGIQETAAPTTYVAVPATNIKTSTLLDDGAGGPAALIAGITAVEAYVQGGLAYVRLTTAAGVLVLASAEIALLPANGVTPSAGASTITYDYNMENQRKLPEIELTVESSPVTAKTRKLRTKWSVEASQDLRAMHNVDAEQELVALLANEIAAEIDREVLNTLITNAGIRTTYDYNDPFITGGLVTITSGGGGTATAVGSGNFDDRNKSLFYQILEVSNQIYRQSLRGSGNWIVTSPEIGAKLESLREFSTDADADFTYNIGIQFAGTLNNKFKVFKDPLFPRDLILIGYKGESFMDAGFFYCPYVPLQITPTVLDTESFNPRKGLMTRYGTVFVENGPRMYGVIKVNNLTAKGSSGITNYGLDAANKSPQTQGRDLIDSGSDLI